MYILVDVSGWTLWRLEPTTATTSHTVSTQKPGSLSSYTLHALPECNDISAGDYPDYG